jgi:hypothetical protein
MRQVVLLPWRIETGGAFDNVVRAAGCFFERHCDKRNKSSFGQCTGFASGIKCIVLWMQSTALMGQDRG